MEKAVYVEKMVTKEDDFFKDPTKMSKPVLRYRIDPRKCTGCAVCATKCPEYAIDGSRKKVHVINQKICSHCGECLTVCKFEAVVVDKF